MAADVPDWAGKRGEQWRDQLVGIEAMLEPVDEPLLAALVLDAPYRIADVGCGGGGTTLAILRRAPRGSVVHGFDLSSALVEAARARITGDARPVAFEVCDMASAVPPDTRYDRLVSRFGIMFFADPPVAFANLSRWLAPGGRFAFAVWGTPSDNPWMMIVRDVVGGIIELPYSDPHGPGLFRYAEVDTLVTLLGQVGFSEVEARPWRGALPLGGPLSVDDAASFALNGFRFAEQLAAAGEGAWKQAHQLLTARLAQHQSGDGVMLGAGVHIVTGAGAR